MSDKGLTLFDERAAECVHLYSQEEQYTYSSFEGTIQCIHLAT